MAASLAVYCRHSVAHLTPGEIAGALRSADLWTLARSRYISRFHVEEALVNLRIENVGANQFEEYVLSYRPVPLPQCILRRLTLVEGVHDSAMDELRTVHHPGMDKIRKHIGRSKDVVSIEVSGPGEQITALLASEIARWIAEFGDGLIARSDQTWWELDDQGAYRRILP